MKKPKTITEKIFERAKSPKDFAYLQILHLRNKYKHLSRLWRVFSILIAILNLVVLGLSIYLFASTIITYDNGTAKGGWLATIGPSIFVLLFTILLFPLTFIATIYQSIMRAQVYKQGMQEIQHVTIRYSEEINQYKLPNKDKIYHRDIENIIKRIKVKEEVKILFKSALKKSIVGDKLD